MRFFTSVAAGVAALASMVAAQTANGPLFFTSAPSSVEVGQSYNLTYQASSIGSPVTILLREGPSNDLTTVATLTTTATGGSFEWKVDDSVPNGSDYALEIIQGTDTNYAGPFILSGSTATATPSASGSSASATVSSTGSASSSTGSVTSSASSSLTTSASTRNSTISTSLTTTTSKSSTASHASTTASSTVSGTGGAPTGAAANLKSPMALVFGAVAAMAYLH